MNPEEFIAHLGNNNVVVEWGEGAAWLDSNFTLTTNVNRRAIFHSRLEALSALEISERLALR